MTKANFPEEVESILEQKAKEPKTEKVEEAPVTFVEDTLKGEFTSIHGVLVKEIVKPGLYFDAQGNKYIKLK